MATKHDAIWFYISTLIYTVVLGGTAQALCLNYIPEQYQTIVSLVLVQMAPTLATFSICARRRDWHCFKSIAWNPFKNAKSATWLLASFTIPAVIITGSSTIMSALGNAYIPHGYSDRLLIVTVFGSLIGAVLSPTSA